MQLAALKRRHDTLAAPLGWILEDFAKNSVLQPAIGLQLLMAERARLHLLAFVLATTPKPLHPEAVKLALSKPMREVLADYGFAGLKGSRRLLGRIDGPILARDHYRLLARLLADPSAAPVLHHMSEVTGHLLENIEALPESMRSPVIVESIAHISDGAAHVLLWTAIVARRLRVTSVDGLRQRLGQCRTLSELRTALEKLVDALPALETAPPALVREGLRIDTPSTIRQLGRRFRNCLAVFSDCEVDGLTHLYHWKTGEIEGVCEVARVGNVGWFLGNCLGPENTSLPDATYRAIVEAFASVDIHPLKVIETYDDLYFSTGGRRTGVDDNQVNLPRRAHRLTIR